MANFPKPSDILAQFKQLLKSLKPGLNVNDPNSDFIIRGNVISGLLSGIYGDQQRVDNDSFIVSMSGSSLDLKGADLGISRQPATQANGPQVRITGSNGIVIAPGELTFIYVPTNILYSNTTGGTVTGGFLDITVLCDIAGQIGNVLSPDTLTLISPPAGLIPITNILQNISDGSNTETDDSYRARLLSREQQPPAGGNQYDYPNFAFAASSSVRSAFIRRFGRGLGTVDIYITVGTTDIDSAVTNGLAILRIPSGITLAQVQAYYASHAPLTDCPMVFAPTELTVNVTVKVNLAQGLTMISIPSDATLNPLNLNCQQLIQREISRVLYKYSVGGRSITGFTNGFVIAADIEAGLDKWLSAVTDPVTGLPTGLIPILADRQVQPLNSPSYNLPILENQLPTPGTLTIVAGV